MCWLFLLFSCVGMGLLNGQRVEASPEIPVAVNSKNAANWVQFEQYIGDVSVDEIKITANFRAEKSIVTGKFPKRNLTIDGQGKYTLDMGLYWLNMSEASATDKSLFTVKDLTVSGLTNGTYPIFYPLGNILHLKNVTLQNRGVVNAPGSTVYFSGKTIFEMNEEVKYLTNLINCRELIIEDDFSFTNKRVPTTTEGEVVATLFNSTAANPSITIKNSNFNVSSNVAIFDLNKPTSFTINKSKLSLENANEFISAKAAVEAKIENEVEVVGKAKSSTGLFNSKVAPVTLTMNNATFKGTKDTGYIAKTEGADAPLTVNAQNSTVDVEKGGFFHSNGSKLTVTSDSSHFITKQMTANFLYGKTIESTMTKSSIKMEGIDSNFIYSVLGVGGSKLSFIDSEIYLRQPDPKTAAMFCIIDKNTEMTFDNTSVDSKTYGRLFSILKDADDSKLTIKNGSKWDAYSKATNVIRTGSDVTADTEKDLTNTDKAKLGSKNFLLTIEGQGTDVKLSGDSKAEDIAAGILAIVGPDSKLLMDDGAKLSVHSLNDKKNVTEKDNFGVATPAILLQTLNGGFYLNNGSQLEVKNFSANPPTLHSDRSHEAAIRFRVAGSMTFEVNNHSKIDIYKQGSSSGIRMFGGNNKILVGYDSDFKVHNKGDGVASDGGVLGNAAIQFISNTGTTVAKDQFIISGENANIELVSDSGLAIDGSINQLDIITSKDSYFVARGQSASESVGIFNAYMMNIDFDTMNYFDFANSRIDGGALFSTKDETSKLNAKKTNLSLWAVEKDQNVMVNDPSEYLSRQNFNLKGINLATFESGSDGIKNYLEKIGGTTKISRLTGNNQRAKIESFRVPTNADKYIWARALVKEGKGAADRPAYEDEVFVKVEVRNPDDTVAYTTQGVSIGNGADGKGVSIYEEAKKTGLVKIPIPEGKFIEAGQSVHLVEAWIDLGNGEKLPSEEADLKATAVTTLDVTPPQKANILPVTNAIKQLTGTSSENGAKVFLKVNNQWLKDSEGKLVSAVVGENNWSINLPYYLTKEDKVDVYLKDETNIQVLPEYTLPKTYTTEPDGIVGNLNCAIDDYSSYQGYHDAKKTGDIDGRFASALRSITEDVIPVPKLEQSITSSGGETTSYGDTLTYTFKATNTHEKAESWKNVILTDVLAEGLAFDSLDHGITIDGELASDNQFSYEESTRKLTIKVGEIQSKQNVIVVFKVKVSQKAVLGKNILNTGKASGDSPQEDPFVVGEIMPGNSHKVLSATSNEMGVPGNAVYGDLSFVSAPESLDFGELHYSATTKRVEAAKFAEKLAINDIRENVKAGWYVTATLSQAMINDKKQELVNAMRYVYKGKENILNDNAQVVYTNLDVKRGEYVISDSWGNSKGSDGVKLQLEGTQNVGTGSYQGVITWKLMAGQP